MKSKINLIISVGVLAFVAMACSGSFTTAKISSFNFGKNDKAEPPTTTFNVGEKVYAVANVGGAVGKHKMSFKVYYENVEGKKKGEEAFSKEIEFEGSRNVFLSLDLPMPGDFKVDAALLGEDGKEIEKKSGTFTVKGSAPAATTEAPKAPAADDKDADSEDK